MPAISTTQRNLPKKGVKVALTLHEVPKLVVVPLL